MVNLTIQRVQLLLEEGQMTSFARSLLDACLL
jgi:hypothetical protein